MAVRCRFPHRSQQWNSCCRPAMPINAGIVAYRCVEKHEEESITVGVCLRPGCQRRTLCWLAVGRTPLPILRSARLTRCYNKQRIGNHELTERVRFHYRDAAFSLRRGHYSQFNRLYYVYWQWLALQKMRHLHRQKPFDLVHHVTYNSVEIPGFLWRLPGASFVWGRSAAASYHRNRCLRCTTVPG